MAGSRGVEVDVAALDGFSRQVTQLCIDGCLRPKEATDGPFRPVDATSRQRPKRRLLGIEGHTGKNPSSERCERHITFISPTTTSQHEPL